MKHTVPVTALLVLFFICAQIVGLVVINEYIDIKETQKTGKTVTKDDAYNITGLAPPPVSNESTSWIMIIIAVLIGTGMVLLIIKFRVKRLWKAWFFMSVIICLTVAFAPFIAKMVPGYGFYVTIIIAGILTYLKVFRPNVYVHNFTELFIYGGLAALIVPIINITSAFCLLIAISIYDAFAVWRSKHMVSMAKFQTESKVFAGLMITYDNPDAKPAKKVKKTTTKSAAKIVKEPEETTRSAILGGGDIAFPLLFSGVVLKTTASFINPLIITAGAAAALYFLLMKGEKNTFYPAMPFISAGCFIGYGIVLLL